MKSEILIWGICFAIAIIVIYRILANIVKRDTTPQCRLCAARDVIRLERYPDTYSWGTIGRGGYFYCHDHFGEVFQKILDSHQGTLMFFFDRVDPVENRTGRFLFDEYAYEYYPRKKWTHDFPPIEMKNVFNQSIHLTHQMCSCCHEVVSRILVLDGYRSNLTDVKALCSKCGTNFLQKQWDDFVKNYLCMYCPINGDGTYFPIRYECGSWEGLG